MATTTTNFSWPIPQSTDLVKDGATAIASLGSGIDTSMAELKGGTTGQMLTKTSNTDMDFTWVTPEIGDITAVVAGSGLSGGGTTGSVTVSLDLTAANVYSAAQTATSYIVTGSTVPTNGLYLSAANTLGLSTNSTNRISISTSTLSSSLPATNLATGATASAVLQLGDGRTVDGNTYIDLVGDTTYTDYGLRIIRNSGANAGSSLISRGTGGFTISTQDAASVAFQTQLTTRMTIDSSGRVGIGTISTSSTLSVASSITGATVRYGIINNGTIASDVTSTARYYSANPATAASAFTITEVSSFYANPVSIGAGSTVTNQYGFIVASGFTGATNNYGFMAQTAAATGVWNFYASGSAANYFAGRTGIGGAVTSTAQFGVTNNQSASDVTAFYKNYASQTADSFKMQNSAGTDIFALTPAGWIKYVNTNTATTVGAAGGASALPANPTGYLKIDIGGTEYKVPYYAA